MFWNYIIWKARLRTRMKYMYLLSSTWEITRLFRGPSIDPCHTPLSTFCVHCKRLGVTFSERNIVPKGERFSFPLGVVVIHAYHRNLFYLPGEKSESSSKTGNIHQLSKYFLFWKWLLHIEIRDGRYLRGSREKLGKRKKIRALH